jgi:hypothetical protein
MFVDVVSMLTTLTHMFSASTYNKRKIPFIILWFLADTTDTASVWIARQTVYPLMLAVTRGYTVILTDLLVTSLTLVLSQSL